MPLSKYFKGSGKKVMAKMKQEYGDKKGEQVFYATANKKDKPENKNDKPDAKGAKHGKGANSYKHKFNHHLEV
jgi:hypothetical protein